MNGRSSYSYSILRYIHDLPTGEFINVGIALFNAEHQYYKFYPLSTFGRVASAFPGVDLVSLRKLIDLIAKRFEHVSSNCHSNLALEDSMSSLRKMIDSVLPYDDSALVWSDISTGICLSPEKTIQSLFDRYVSKYVNTSPARIKKHKTDNDMWKSFNKSLVERNISKYFNKTTIQAEDDQVDFKKAWKNGIWHCLEPLSFDLKSSSQIREKAHKFIGELTSISDQQDAFKVYLILGKPESPALNSSFARVQKLLAKKLPYNAEFYLEEQKDSLVDKLALSIQEHEQEISIS